MTTLLPNNTPLNAPFCGYYCVRDNVFLGGHFFFHNSPKNTASKALFKTINRTGILLQKTIPTPYQQQHPADINKHNNKTLNNQKTTQKPHNLQTITNTLQED